MLIHGMRYSAEYSSWLSMRARCLNKNSKDFPRYGANGVTICAEWDSFKKFYEHIGSRPLGTTLERIDTTKGYVAGNVCWATPLAQACNRSNSRRWFIDGIEFASAELAAAHFGVSDVTIHRWVKGGSDPRRGTTFPPKKGCYVENRY